MAYDLRTSLILRIWVIQFRICVMKNYMEKRVIPLRMVCKALCAILVLIPGARNKMKMIMDKVMKRFRHKRILNDMKREINKLMGVIGMTMQNMEMV
jgi:hypothetical protein